MDTTHPLIAYRTEKGISRAQLAELLGVERQTVFRWERGERQIDRSLWHRVSERTAIPISVLANFEGSAP